MSYTRHHAIIVTSWQPDGIRAAREFALGLGCTVTEIVGSPVNAYETFIVVPDGSNGGWDESTLGNERREALVAWLSDRARYEDRRYYDWAEVQYGDGERNDRLVRSSASVDHDDSGPA